MEITPIDLKRPCNAPGKLIRNPHETNSPRQLNHSRVLQAWVASGRRARPLRLHELRRHDLAGHELRRPRTPVRSTRRRICQTVVAARDSLPWNESDGRSPTSMWCARRGRGPMARFPRITIPGRVGWLLPTTSDAKVRLRRSSAAVGRLSGKAGPNSWASNCEFALKFPENLPIYGLTGLIQSILNGGREMRERRSERRFMCADLVKVMVHEPGSTTGARHRQPGGHFPVGCLRPA